MLTGKESHLGVFTGKLRPGDTLVTMDALIVAALFAEEASRSSLARSGPFCGGLP